MFGTLPDRKAFSFFPALFRSQPPSPSPLVSRNLRGKRKGGRAVPIGYSFIRNLLEPRGRRKSKKGGEEDEPYKL